MDFPPTYRLDIHTDDWSKVKLYNVPSYTDRILWKEFPCVQVCQHRYTSVPRIFGSDHRPVVATFTVEAWKPVMHGLPRARSVRIYGLQLYFLSKLICDHKYTDLLQGARGINVSISNTYMLTPRSATEGFGSMHVRGVLERKPVSLPKAGTSASVARQEASSFSGSVTQHQSMDTGAATLSPARFVADDLITFSMGELSLLEAQRQYLAVRVTVGATVIGQGEISLRHCCVEAPTGQPKQFELQLSSHGLPLGGCAGSIICCEDPQIGDKVPVAPAAS